MPPILERICAASLQPTPVDESAAFAVGLAAVVAALLVLPRAVWAYSGLVVTVVHELGHGLAGLLTGRRVVGIRISGDHAGLTTSTGTRASAPFSTFFGYPAPAIYGAALVAAALWGRAGSALALSLLVLVVSLVFMRGALTWLTVLIVLALGIGALGWLPGAWLSSVVGGVGAYFLVGSLRGFGNVLRAHARGRTGDSDAALMARATGVPAAVWLLLMALVIAACIAAAGWAFASIV